MTIDQGRRTPVYNIAADISFMDRLSLKGHMKRILLLVISLYFPLIAFTQAINISGTVSGADGQTIRMIAHDDFISKKIITLDKCAIGNDGSFELNFAIRETIIGYLDINYQRAEIFLEPDSSYVLEISYDKENQLASYFDRQGMLYNLVEPEGIELNRRIWQFNEMYNTFVMINFDKIYKLRERNPIIDFRNEIRSAFPDTDSGYFADYVTYKLADIEQYARLKGRNTLAGDYFTGKPVLKENVEYIFFFEQFFEKYLITSPEIITISDLIVAVNDNADKQFIMDALAKETYLKEKNFRELVLLHGLRSLYFDATFERPQLLRMMEDISKTTSNPVHRKIALNLLTTLTALNPGTPAPDLQLTGIAGQKFNLRNITGKPILLNFFRSGQQGTANAFDRLSELYNLYNAGLEIISVSMDHNASDYLELANSGNYYWTFAHYGNDPLVYDKYNIRDMPLYILIDVEGNIYSCPAPSPGDALEKLILKVIH